MRQVSPHPGRTRLVATPHGPLAVLVAVPPDAGQGGPRAAAPVLLVPGFTGSKEDFAPMLGPLRDHGRLVVAMDQRGQHESSGPDDEERYEVDALAADVHGVADALGLDRPHLVGHSFGGLVARAAVLADPSRFRTLTLLGSGPAALGGPRGERLALLAPVLDEGGLAGLHAAMEAVAPYDPHYVEPPPELRRFLRTRFLAQSETALRAMGRHLQEEPDRVADLAATGVPVLVAHGAHDDAWAPEVQREMAARLGAAYEVVADAFHSPNVENPAATVSALELFWGRHGERTV